MKKKDAITYLIIALIAGTLSPIILYVGFKILEPEKYTGDVSIKVAPEITGLGEDWYYNFEIAAWAEPRDTYLIEIRWLYPSDPSENIDIDGIAGSKEEVLTSTIKDFRMEVQSPYKAPRYLKSIWAVVELLGPEKRSIASDHGLVKIIRE